MNSTSWLPLLVIFDAEKILWPYSFLPLELKFPCEKINGTVYDKNNNTKIYYPEVPAVCEKLKNDGIKMGIIGSRKGLRLIDLEQILELFDLDKYISYKEVEHNGFSENLERVQKSSSIPFGKIIFFHYTFIYKRENMTSVYKGIHSKHIDFGITMKHLDDALKQYQTDWEKRKISHD